MSGALDGMRVIDITTIFLGPFATRTMGDMGADVIKIEPPQGDSTRYLGASRNPGMGGIFLNLNINKRSLSVDLKKSSGNEILRRLIPTADVLIHNMRPAAMERLGFGYDAVAALKPDIVYCVACGYSERGPYGPRPAYDDAVQAESGLAALFRDTVGQPLYAPTIVVDKMVGVTAAQAVAFALLHRERTGEGQYVEVPMFETMISFLLAEHIYERAFVPPLGPAGYKRVTTPERRPYPTRDGHICMLPYTDAQWHAFFEMAGRPDMKDDPRFADFTTRTEHVAALYGFIAEVAPMRSTDEWLSLCAEAHIPAARMNAINDLFDDPHLRQTGFFRPLAHPSEGETIVTGPPVAYSKSPATIRRPAPRLGEHGTEILCELGYDAPDIDALCAEGALILPQPDD